AEFRTRISEAGASWPLARAGRPASRAMAVPDRTRPVPPRKARRGRCKAGVAAKARNDMMLLLEEKDGVAPDGEKRGVGKTCAMARRRAGQGRSPRCGCSGRRQS